MPSAASMIRASGERSAFRLKTLFVGGVQQGAEDLHEHLNTVEAPLNRLGAAQWLVSKDNPLTPRVAVNRLWARLFGG